MLPPLEARRRKAGPAGRRAAATRTERHRRVHREAWLGTRMGPDCVLARGSVEGFAGCGSPGAGTLALP
eukprot:6812067-Alexandrium_andersonii.AAC.1